MEWKIPLFSPDYDGREVGAVTDVIRGGWLTMGPKTKDFEACFGALLAAKAEAVAVSSATAALHIAVLALDIGVGDEVVLSALTFIAGANVVRMVGAAPVLADCTSTSDWNVDPNDVVRKIGPRTKAVLVTHYAGYPCDMDSIVEICRSRGIALVEDSAHAIGASWRGQHCGTFGSAGCFSFFSNKNLAVGEGGMFVSADPGLVRRARLIRSHGMDAATLDRHEGRAISYDVLEPGLNYRIDEIRSALGIVQLERLAGANARRGEIVARYRDRLHGARGVSMPFRILPSWSQPCWHILPVLLEDGADRVRVMNELRGHGIQSSIHYPPIRRFSAYVSLPLGGTPIADRISESELTLPLYPGMSDADVDTVVSCLRRALR